MDRLTGNTQTDIKSGKAPSQSVNAAASGVRRRLWRFFRHFLEMQFAMGVGALVCLLLTRLIAASSVYSTIYRPGTYLFMIGDVLFLTVPVVAWMTIRGQGWGHGLGMAVAMIAPVVAIAVVGELASYAYLTWLLIAGYPAMSLGMLVYMVFRREIPLAGYAGQRHGVSTAVVTNDN